jgi:hypothetical protein
MLGTALGSDSMKSRLLLVLVTALSGLTFGTQAYANVYTVEGLGLDATITTDAGNNVIAITGTVGTFAGDSQDPGAISGPVSPANIVFTGGGTNIFGLDGLFLPTSPHFTDSCCGGLGFTFVNATDGGNTIGAALGLSGIADSGAGPYELFMGVATDRQGDLTITEISGVPELSTWAMMIVGFFGVGFMAYRRKQSGPALRIA